MIINNLASRLRLAPNVSANHEAERRRIKEATKALRTHAEKIAWHLAEMASQAAAIPGPVPVPVRVRVAQPSRPRR